ncbi:MAG: HEAT repeat domain-containing protein [Anaerolineales bacterium]|jgi:HEAT repeat protein
MFNNEAIPYKDVLDALLDLDKPFHHGFLYRFSDLGQQELTELRKIWPEVPTWRRLAIMEDIEELGESNYLLSYKTFSMYTVQDDDAKVREVAVRTLWEYESPDLVPIFLDILDLDPDPDVRGVTASALGKFIYLGEIEELPPKTLKKIEEKLLKVFHSSENTVVRRRCLEALGYSSREEVPALIESAYYSGKNEWLTSALFAMGRSANRNWKKHILEMLDYDTSEVRSEAARAAGELEISEAVPYLIELLEDDNINVRSAAIWSLSQTGGEGVNDILQQLHAECEDEEEADFIEAALDNLAFTEDMELFTLLDIPEDEEGGYPNGTFQMN